MPVHRPTLLISRDDLRELMTPASYLAAVRDGFRLGQSGEAFSPMPMHMPVPDGGFHAKGAVIRYGRRYAAVKLNGNFPGNPARHGLPTIQGAILLCDGETGSLLAIIDSSEVTLRRTAAASALAAQMLARPGSGTILVCGCGEQGRAHLEALAEVLPLSRCYAWDRVDASARSFAAVMGKRPGIEVVPMQSPGAVSRECDMIVTCTTSREPFLGKEDVAAGTFVAAVGADSEGKSELHPELVAAATLIVDVPEQCAAMGDFHHALESGLVGLDHPRASLGELVAGDKVGRRSDREIVIFDSTGTALQDVAAAVFALQAAEVHGRGTPLTLG